MSQGWQEILYKVEDRVATIALNRPEKLNAWTAVMAGELREALAKAEADEDVRAIVLTGAGRGFCAGADMSRLAAAAAGKSTLGVPPMPTEGMEANFAQRMSYMLAVKKPIIAAINGPVAGVGLVARALLRHPLHGGRRQAHDLVRAPRADRRARHRLAAAAADRADARARPALLGAHGGGRGGRRHGPRARAARPRASATAVQARAAEIANLSSPRSTRIIKKQVYEAMFQSLAEATVAANREQEICRDTEDFREGVAHFMEKRTPRFTGR